MAQSFRAYYHVGKALDYNQVSRFLVGGVVYTVAAMCNPVTVCATLTGIVARRYCGVTLITATM